MAQNTLSTHNTQSDPREQQWRTTMTNEVNKKEKNKIRYHTRTDRSKKINLTIFKSTLLGNTLQTFNRQNNVYKGEKVGNVGEQSSSTTLVAHKMAPL